MNDADEYNAVQQGHYMLRHKHQLRGCMGCVLQWDKCRPHRPHCGVWTTSHMRYERSTEVQSHAAPCCVRFTMLHVMCSQYCCTVTLQQYRLQR